MYDYPEYSSDNDNYDRYEDINQHCLLLDQTQNRRPRSSAATVRLYPSAGSPNTDQLQPLMAANRCSASSRRDSYFIENASGGAVSGRAGLFVVDALSDVWSIEDGQGRHRIVGPVAMADQAAPGPLGGPLGRRRIESHRALMT